MNNAISFSTQHKQIFYSVAWGQIHQHFMSSLCATVPVVKILQTQTLSTLKLYKTRSYEKAAYNILVNLTPGVNFTNPLAQSQTCQHKKMRFSLTNRIVTNSSIAQN